MQLNNAATVFSSLLLTGVIAAGGKGKAGSSGEGRTYTKNTEQHCQAKYARESRTAASSGSIVTSDDVIHYAQPKPDKFNFNCVVIDASTSRATPSGELTVFRTLGRGAQDEHMECAMNELGEVKGHIGYCYIGSSSGGSREPVHPSEYGWGGTHNPADRAAEYGWGGNNQPADRAAESGWGGRYAGRGAEAGYGGRNQPVDRHCKRYPYTATQDGTVQMYATADRTYQTTQGWVHRGDIITTESAFLEGTARGAEAANIVAHNAEVLELPARQGETFYGCVTFAAGTSGSVHIV